MASPSENEKLHLSSACCKRNSQRMAQCVLKTYIYYTYTVHTHARALDSKNSNKTPKENANEREMPLVLRATKVCSTLSGRMYLSSSSIARYKNNTILCGLPNSDSRHRCAIRVRTFQVANKPYKIDELINFRNKRKAGNGRIINKINQGLDLDRGENIYRNKAANNR